MKNRDRGCSSACRLDPKRPKGQEVIKSFRRNRPDRKPEACGRRTIEPAKETK